MSPRTRDFMIALAALAALLAVGLLIEHPWPRDFLTSIFAYGLLAMSLNLLIGFTGLVSFGHAAYFGIGGYAMGILAFHAQTYTPVIEWPFVIEGSKSMPVIW